MKIKEKNKNKTENFQSCKNVGIKTVVHMLL